MPDTPILPYAERWRRFVAQAVDGVIFVLINYLLFFFFKKDLFLGQVILLILIAAYYIGMLQSRWQATFGKRLMQIYVVTKEGGKPSFLRVASRFFLFMIPGLPAFIPSLYILYLTPQELANNVNSLQFQYAHELELALLSAVFGILAIVAVFLLIWYVPLFFTRERKSIPDMVCGTRVVKGNTASLPKE